MRANIAIELERKNNSTISHGDGLKQSLWHLENYGVNTDAAELRLIQACEWEATPLEFESFCDLGIDE